MASPAVASPTTARRPTGGLGTAENPVRVVALYVLLASGLSLVAVWQLDGAMPDDAWITLRYARNLADGHGWTYNFGGGASGGATSPLYVMLLALLLRVGVSASVAASSVFVAGMTMAATGAAMILRRGRLSVGSWIVVVLLPLHPFLVSTRGMESGLFLGVVSLAGWFALQERWTSAGLFAAASVMVRGEGALVASR